MNKTYKKECESVCEYSLPDYLGDVKKILTVSATVIPSGKYATDGEVNFSGVVSYDVLYSDSEGKLTGLTASSDYDITVPIDSDDYIDSSVDVRVANLSVRLTGPRKLTAKAVVSGNVKVSCENNLKCAGDAFAEGNSLEQYSRTVKIEKSNFTYSSEREYAEEAERLVGVTPDEIEIIATSGAVRITETIPSESGILVRGELIITSIVRTEEQPAFAIKKTVPFEETITFEGLSSDMKIMADGYLTSVTAGVSEDADGSVITVNAISELYCMVSENEDVAVICDAYLEACDTVSKYEDFEYSSVVCMGMDEEKITASVLRTDIGCENIRDILTIGADVRSFEKKINSNGFSLEGEMQFSGVACEINEGGKASYIPVKFSCPFSVSKNCNMVMPSGAQLECTVIPIDTECVLDLEKAVVNCSIKIGYRITNSEVIRRITDCTTVGQTQCRPCLSNITVYYPDEDESLFEIAKKFHTTSKKIAEDNDLSEQTFADTGSPVSNCGVKRLIIR